MTPVERKDNPLPSEPRTETEILDELHELQREEDAIRDRKRDLDREMAKRHRLELVKASAEDVTIATTGQG